MTVNDKSYDNDYEVLLTIELSMTKTNKLT